MRTNVLEAFWPNEPYRRFGQTKPSGRMRVGSERSTNLRLYEIAAGAVPLFPDCYLQ